MYQHWERKIFTEILPQGGTINLLMIGMFLSAFTGLKYFQMLISPQKAFQISCDNNLNRFSLKIIFIITNIKIALVPCMEQCILPSHRNYLFIVVKRFYLLRIKKLNHKNFWYFSKHFQNEFWFWFASQLLYIFRNLISTV